MKRTIVLLASLVACGALATTASPALTVYTPITRVVCVHNSFHYGTNCSYLSVHGGLNG